MVPFPCDAEIGRVIAHHAAVVVEYRSHAWRPPRRLVFKHADIAEVEQLKARHLAPRAVRPYLKLREVPLPKLSLLEGQPGKIHRDWLAPRLVIRTYTTRVGT